MRNATKMTGCLIIILSAIGCATTPKYQCGERGDIVISQVITRQDIEQHLGMLRECPQSAPTCTTKTVEAASRIADFMNRHLPTQFKIETHASSTTTVNPREMKYMPHPVVDVTALSEQRFENKPLPFTSMSPRGQQALIEYATKKSKNTKEDADAVQELFAAIAPSSEQDPFDANRSVRLIVSSSLNAVAPADRLEKIYAFVYVPEGAKITDADKLETDKPKTDFGKQTNEFALEGTLGPKVTSDVLKGSAEIKSSYKRTLERTLSREYARRTIGINSELDTLFISQDGLEGVDLSGNLSTTITLQIQSKPTRLTSFSCEEGKKGSAPSQKQDCKEKITPLYMQNFGTLKGLVTWVAVVRHVVDGGDSVMEDDDTVVPLVYQGISRITLWRNTEQHYFLVLNYREETETGAQCKSAALVFEELNKKPRYVAFKSATEAEAFRNQIVAAFANKKGSSKNGEVFNVKGIKVGFAIDANGKIDDEKVNAMVNLKNEKNEDVDMTGLKMFVTDPDDFPISSSHVWKRTCSK